MWYTSKYCETGYVMKTDLLKSFSETKEAPL